MFPATNQKPFLVFNFGTIKEIECPLSLEEAKARKEALEDYKKWALLEETSWRQKSREIWLREGDKNTRFFHKMVNACPRRVLLTKVRIQWGYID